MIGDKASMNGMEQVLRDLMGDLHTARMDMRAHINERDEAESKISEAVARSNALQASIDGLSRSLALLRGEE